MVKDFVDLADFTGEQLASLLRRAIDQKAQFRAGSLAPALKGKTLAMVFEKPSLRTRVSFEAAMTHLGGHAIYLAPTDIGLGTREPVQDVARVLGRMCDGICARTFKHQTVLDLARFSPVPVINALSDFAHPCQAMADLMTAAEHFGELAGKTLAFVGDGNNVARSLLVACSKVGMKFVLACPVGYEIRPDAIAGFEGALTTVHDARQAVGAADIVYTDTWVSMGQEAEKAERVKVFEGFQLNADLLDSAPDHAIVMHCLPAYRDCEITDDLFEAHAEIILAEAENRLHFQRTLLDVLITEGGVA